MSRLPTAPWSEKNPKNRPFAAISSGTESISSLRYSAPKEICTSPPGRSATLPAINPLRMVWKYSVSKSRESKRKASSAADKLPRISKALGANRLTGTQPSVTSGVKNTPSGAVQGATPGKRSPTTNAFPFASVKSAGALPSARARRSSRIPIREDLPTDRVNCPDASKDQSAKFKNPSGS